MKATPIVYPLSKVEQQKAHLKAQKFIETAVSWIPLVGDIAGSITAGIMALLGQNNWEDLTADTWKKVHDQNAFNWRGAHTQSKNELLNNIKSLNNELTVIIPNRKSKSANTFIPPYTFLMGEYMRIAKENYGISGTVESISARSSSTLAGLMKNPIQLVVVIGLIFGAYKMFSK